MNKVYVSIENSENDLWCTELPILQANISEVKMVRILAQLILTQYGKHILINILSNKNANIC